jgi:hypothetical protein
MMRIEFADLDIEQKAKSVFPAGAGQAGNQRRAVAVAACAISEQEMVETEIRGARGCIVRPFTGRNVMRNFCKANSGRG